MTDQLLDLLDQEEVLEGAEESGFSLTPLLSPYLAAAPAVWEAEAAQAPAGKAGDAPLPGASPADDLVETQGQETLPLLAQMQAMDRAGQALALGGTAAGQREGGAFSPLPLPGSRGTGGAGEFPSGGGLHLNRGGEVPGAGDVWSAQRLDRIFRQDSRYDQGFALY